MWTPINIFAETTDSNGGFLLNINNLDANPAFREKQMPVCLLVYGPDMEFS